METFIVRVREPMATADQADDAGLRGVVHHVRTGGETRFASWEELRAVLDAASIGPTAGAAGARGRGEGRAR